MLGLGRHPRPSPAPPLTARAPDGERLLQAAILANIPEGVALVRAADGVLVWVNETWARMFGYRPGELVGQHISVVNAPVGVTPLERADEIIGSLERDGHWQGEVENVRKDGRRFWCQADLSRFEHPEHGIVRIAVHADITERRRAEGALHEAEQRFRTAFEEGPVGIVVLDPDGRLVEVNESFSTVTGYTREELVGRTLDELTHPEDRVVGADLAARVFRGELRRYRVVKLYVTKDGDHVPVAVTATMVRDPAGRPLYGLAIVEDASARRAAALQG